MQCPLRIDNVSAAIMRSSCAGTTQIATFELSACSRVFAPVVGIDIKANPGPFQTAQNAGAHTNSVLANAAG